MTAPGEIPPATLAALLRVGHEVARRARALGAERLSVEIAGASGPLLFTRAGDGAVWAAGEGFDVALSHLAGWPSTRRSGI